MFQKLVYRFKALSLRFLMAMAFLLPAWKGYGQSSFRMSVLSHYNNPDLPKVDGTDIWNDLTGYFDPVTKREYIICGSTDSIYFFDITDPKAMKLVDVEYGKCFYATNRDFETYRHYAYCVADQYSGVGALQVFDLQYLPDSVHKVYEGNEAGYRTHTIMIDTSAARMYMCSNLSPRGLSAMDVISLKNPEQPAFSFALKVPKSRDGWPIFNLIHEMYVRSDTVYLSAGNAGLYIFDLRDSASQPLLSSIIDYPEKGYNHSSWLDKSGRYLMFTDETLNLGLDAKIYDMKNFAEPTFVSSFNSSALATPHNAYWYGDFAYLSAYHDGVRVYNVKDPGNPVQVAWYDTHPTDPENWGAYRGCWGVWPYLPSGNIIASDLTEGIFVLSLDSGLLSVPEMPLHSLQVEIYPNPAGDKLHISQPFPNNEIRLLSCDGKVIFQMKATEESIDLKTEDLPAGIYFVSVSNEEYTTTQKVIIQH